MKHRLKRSTSDPINVVPLTPDKIKAKYRDRKRIGKTARDKAKIKA